MCVGRNSRIELNLVVKGGGANGLPGSSESPEQLNASDSKHNLKQHQGKANAWHGNPTFA